jgi:mannose-6-phosphate isomerase-like protein (cupin superfamily)
MNKTNRPWGSYEVLLDDKDCKVKKIVVLSGENPSYQYHHKRTEDWIIVSGEGEVTLNDKTIFVKPGSTIHVPVLSKHKIKNTGTSNLVFIEIQTGTYFGEDDIVRLEDKYGRA